ncbi:MAG: radical SAM protein, partial [Anaerolineales bacterium]
IFLGDANALIAAMPLLRELLKIVHRFFDVSSLGGIYAFLDGFSGALKSLPEYQELAQLQVKRVYIGLESGNADLLKLLKKPSDPEKAIETVRSIKMAGMSVGIIILLGAGGHKYSMAHIEDTVKVLNEMKLNADDIIYFSELVESEGLAYTRQAYQAQLKPMTPDERIKQGEAIEYKLIFPDGSTPHIARYDIREFVY